MLISLKVNQFTCVFLDFWLTFSLSIKIKLQYKWERGHFFVSEQTSKFCRGSDSYFPPTAYILQCCPHFSAEHSAFHMIWILFENIFFVMNHFHMLSKLSIRTEIQGLKKCWHNFKVKVHMIHTFKCQIWSPHIALRLIWSSIWVTLKSSFGQLPKSLHRWRTHLSNYLSQDLHLNWISIKKQDLPVNVSQCTPCVISSSSI